MIILYIFILIIGLFIFLWINFTRRDIQWVHLTNANGTFCNPLKNSVIESTEPNNFFHCTIAIQAQFGTYRHNYVDISLAQHRPHWLVTNCIIQEQIWTVKQYHLHNQNPRECYCMLESNKVYMNVPHFLTKGTEVM